MAQAASEKLLGKQFSFQEKLRSMNVGGSHQRGANQGAYENQHQFEDNQQRPQVMDNLTQNSFFHMIRGYQNNEDG